MNDSKLIGHLDALRRCLIRASAGLMIGVVTALLFSPTLLKIFQKPYADFLLSINPAAIPVLRSLSPADTLYVSLKIAFLFGLGISSPWVAYQIWSFVSPGLYKHERKHVTLFCAAAAAFFVSGAAFAYFAALPAALSFFYKYTTSVGVTPDWAIDNYMGFVISFLLGFGIVFEMPVAVVVSTLLGITSSKALSKFRKHAIVAIFIVAGIVTPGPDVISQFLMAIPMYFLYEISVLAARFIEGAKSEECEQTA